MNIKILLNLLLLFFFFSVNANTKKAAFDKSAFYNAMAADDINSINTQLNIVNCLLYTSDAADDLLCVVLGGLRIIKKKKRGK